MDGIEMGLPLPVIDIFNDGSYAVITERYHVRAWPVTVSIEPGFVFDGASIPEFARPIIGGPWDPRRLPAATVHDWLYSSHAVCRWVADLVFLLLLVRHGHGMWRSLVDWFAVARFGRKSWDSHLPDERRLLINMGDIRFFT